MRPIRLLLPALAPLVLLLFADLSQAGRRHSAPAPTNSESINISTSERLLRNPVVRIAVIDAIELFRLGFPAGTRTGEPFVLRHRTSLFHVCRIGVTAAGVFRGHCEVLIPKTPFDFLPRPWILETGGFTEHDSHNPGPRYFSMTEGTQTPPYRGFEQGPIRPPSEATSLLVRVTRNCHWNRCAFCPVYKGARFSIRPVEHILWDLDRIARHVENLALLSAGPGILLEADIREAFNALPPEENAPFRAALSWFVSGMESVFLQDADSLVLRPVKLIEILTRLKEIFPQVKRITSYSRSDTIDRLAEDDLRALREAGLNRIHIGMESGCDEILAMMHKGATKELHVRAGLKVKAAGIELSEYYMPGLGGCDLWREHAQDTADAMNRINPDFIRLRTLAIPERAPLAEEVRAGHFRKCPDLSVAEEILLFLDILEGVTGYLASDHVLNLFPELEGRLPDDMQRMKDLLWGFLTLEPETRFIYQLGRRLGIMSRLSDTDDPDRKAEVQEAARRLGATPENLDEITDTIVRRFI